VLVTSSILLTRDSDNTLAYYTIANYNSKNF